MTNDEEQIKEQIIEEAVRKRFDRSPLLNTTHRVTCYRCNHELKVVYLDYIRGGRFKIGRSQTIEGENPLGAFMAIEEERATPIVLELTCEYCGNIIEVRPVTVEYLRTITNKSENGSMYA